MPGRFSERRWPHADAGSVYACSNEATTCRGDASHSSVSASTGQIAASPASGSRMMPDAKLDAAPFGLPGRTDTVGMRTARPSM